MIVPAEQRSYARTLDWASRLGLALLVVTFAAYVFGFVAPLVPPEKLPQYWTLPLERYLELTGGATGWAWLGLLGKGEYLSLLGVAALALATLGCYLQLGVLLLRGGRRVPATIAFLQILVLLAAVSGLLAGG